MSEKEGKAIEEREQAVRDGDGRERGDDDGGEGVHATMREGATFSFGCGDGK